MKKSLRASERNVLIAALRDGKSWEEAKKALPKGIDLRAIDGWKDALVEEAKKAAPVAQVSTRIDMDEVIALRKENANLKEDLARVKAENEELKALVLDDKPKKR